jgi:NADP-dependent 3-hydroxy acid dehydrogenase YdfG
MTGHALVVGASSSIGTAIAEVLAECGHDLTVWGRDGERLQRAAVACRARGVVVSVDEVDLRRRESLPAAVAAVRARGPLTVAVLASGLFHWGAVTDADVGAWYDVLDVNLAAAAALSALLAPALVAAAPSALVYLGSLADHRAFPDNAAYIASKHGLKGLARATWLDLRDRGVKVSIVSPGLVAAGAGLESPEGAHPERLLRPGDVAEAVRYVVTSPPHLCPTELVLEPQSLRGPALVPEGYPSSAEPVRNARASDR